MPSDQRTIVLLSAKRCGTTALFRVFQKHSEVNIPHHDKDIDNWEPNFWNNAVKALRGDENDFREKLQESLPSLDVPDNLDKNVIFELWDTVLDCEGPILFDKTPNYLGNEEALELLEEYKDKGNDVRVFAIIRDPRDAITSQFIHWKQYVDDDSPKRREKKWLEKYEHMEQLRKRFETLPVFRYEDLAQAPYCYINDIFEYCGVASQKDTYQHIKPVNIGRYSIESNTQIAEWEFTEAFVQHLEKYGYSVPQEPNIRSLEFGYKKVLNRVTKPIQKVYERIT